MSDHTPRALEAEAEPPPDPSTFTFSLALLVDPDSDPDAHRREWTRVVAHFGPRLNNYWRDRVPDDADRDYLINEIWRRTLVNIARMTAPGQMWKWLLGYGQNVFRSHMRDRIRDARRSERDAALGPEHSMADAPMSTLERLAITDEVAALFNRGNVSERDQGILMQWARGIEHKEIAAEFGFETAGASRKHVERLIKRLRAAHDPGSA